MTLIDATAGTEILRALGLEGDREILGIVVRYTPGDIVKVDIERLAREPITGRPVSDEEHNDLLRAYSHFKLVPDDEP